jgi:hypothetical protein
VRCDIRCCDAHASCSRRGRFLRRVLYCASFGVKHTGPFICHQNWRAHEAMRMLASVALRTSMGSRRRSGLAFEGARAQPSVSGGAFADLALGSGRNARTTAELMGHMHMTR